MTLPPPIADTERPPDTAAKPELPPLLDLKTLAKQCGQLAPLTVDGGEFLAKHRVAAFLHGWDQYEYHQASPVLLTLEDYKAALEHTDKLDGSYKPHDPAMRLRNEKHETNREAEAQAKALAKAAAETIGASQ